MVTEQHPLPRLLLIGPVPPPAGGMANQTAQLKRLLEDDGMAVELLPVNPPYRPAWTGRVPVLRALVRLLGYFPRLWAALGRNDIVHLMANSGWSWHLFAAPAIVLSRLRKKPVAVNYRGGEAGPFLAKQARWVVPILGRADALVTPSAFLAELFREYGLCPAIIPNIVDARRFFPAPEIPAHPHVVVTRNLEPIYDIPTALRAFASLVRDFPEARLSIAGSGPELANLKTLAEHLGISTTTDFCGRLSPDEVAALYRRASIALNPSRVDNMPNSVLEALACGVPVVSTNVGGVPYIVSDDQTALLVDAGDHVAMAEALRRLIQEPDLAGRLRARGLERIQAFFWPEVRAQWLELYRRMAGLG